MAHRDEERMPTAIGPTPEVESPARKSPKSGRKGIAGMWGIESWQCYVGSCSVMKAGNGNVCAI